MKPKKQLTTELFGNAFPPTLYWRMEHDDDDNDDEGTQSKCSANLLKLLLSSSISSYLHVVYEKQIKISGQLVAKPL